MPEINESRELTPIQKFWDISKTNGFRDFSPRVMKVDQQAPQVSTPPPVVDEEALEAEEAEEALNPAPKADSVPASAPLPDLSEPTGQTKLDFPALPAFTTPTVKSEDVDKESGKGNDESEPELPTPQTPNPLPESSSPSSSPVPTKSGSSAPPAPAQPPTNA